MPRKKPPPSPGLVHDMGGAPQKLPPQTRQPWLRMFMDFISMLRIESKEEEGLIPLKPYGSQHRFLEELCKGLDEGIRFFINLKARQLGITTIMLAVDLFWMNMYPGIRGAMIADSDENREIFRDTLVRYIGVMNEIYPGFLSPVEKHNRVLLRLANGSRLEYLVAGKKRNSGLGTSRGLNFVHATEVGKWGGGEGLDSLMSTLAEQHPHRLYVFESTAEGFNHWRTMWRAAKEDYHTQRGFFIGWWAKEIYRIPKSDPRYAEAMQDPPSPEEVEKQRIVYEQYGVQVDSEQLAWYRWRARNRSYNEGAIEQEFPWHEEEAFVVTGKHFFPARKLGEDLRRVMDGKSVLFKAYRYILGEEFTGTELNLMDMQQVRHSSEAHLRVWEEPKPKGVYAIGVDPAFGRNDHQDRHCISVARCFADRLVQVAEYATPDPETWQVVWVLAHLASLYQDCYINIEQGGPGAHIFTAFKNLRSALRFAAVTKGAPDVPRAFTDALNGAKWYLYHRPDSMGAGYAYGWMANANNQMHLMNQFRDEYQLGHLVIRSGPLIQEMQICVQDGSHIGAYGHGKDDRVYAKALCVEAWAKWQRPRLMAMGHTWALVQEAERKNELPPDNDGLVGGIVKHFFKETEQQRQEEMRARAFGERPMR